MFYLIEDMGYDGILIMRFIKKDDAIQNFISACKNKIEAVLIDGKQIEINNFHWLDDMKGNT